MITKSQYEECGKITTDCESLLIPSMSKFGSHPEKDNIVLQKTLMNDLNIVSLNMEDDIVNFYSNSMINEIDFLLTNVNHKKISFSNIKDDINNLPNNEMKNHVNIKYRKIYYKLNKAIVNSLLKQDNILFKDYFELLKYHEQQQVVMTYIDKAIELNSINILKYLQSINL
jgi:hypothetical protein